MEIKLTLHVVLKIVVKILELICVIAAIALSVGNSFTISLYRGVSFFGDGTLMMAIVITPLLLAFSLAGNKKITIFDALVNFILGIFLIATGSVAIRTGIDLLIPSPLISKILGMGSVCIIGGFFYLVDCFHSFFIFKTSD